MNNFTFDCSHLLLGVVSCLHLLSAFACLVQTAAAEPIPDDVMRLMVREAI